MHTYVHASVRVNRDVNGDELDPWFLSELLMDIGAMSVSVDDSALGTKEESPLLHDHIQSKVRVCRLIYGHYVRRRGPDGDSCFNPHPCAIHSSTVVLL